MNIVTNILFGLTTIFLTAVIALTFLGKITFGHGLGDLFYTMIAGFILIVVAAIYQLTKRINLNKNKIVGALISVGLLMIIYIFSRLVTVDRGSEYKWNGRVFISDRSLTPKNLVELSTPFIAVQARFEFRFNFS